MDINYESKKLNVLVLGVGGNVSQGILKALAISSLPCRVIGACTSHLAMGLYTVDRAYLSPPAAAPGFMDWLIELCLREEINAILSGVEPVLSVLADNATYIEEKSGAVCIVSSSDKMNMSIDKLETCKWLESNGFNFPCYADSSDNYALEALLNEKGYPLIAKPKTGKGSQGVFILESKLDIDYVRRKENFVIQEYIGKEDAEFTVGCFCDGDNKLLGAMAMRRDLQQGTTVRAELGDYPEVEQEAKRIALALQPVGPCNIQMRMSGEKAVCFEINLRFSGTTPFRSRLGFNEVEAALRHFVLGEKLKPFPEIKQGIILRYWNEIYIEPSAANSLLEKGFLLEPHDYELLVEDYGRR